MRPYVDPGSTANETTDGSDGSPSDTLPDSLFSYDLFAVVTHEGKLDNGHYWADVRCGEEWWHCDDDKGGRDRSGTMSDTQ
jgi:ubiquitin carboxyl-terminal hydrolase 22/27/51